jgi:predicted negative regulator of RcsB-dependent stress response
MAEDFLTEEEQIEATKRFLAENGVWLVGTVALTIALFYGYRYYEHSRVERALKAASEFATMTAAIDKNERSTARRIAENIVQTYSGSPYADQAELALARLFVDEGKIAEAAGPLAVVMTSSKDSELKNIARLRLARIQIDQGKSDDAIQTLAGGADSASFASRYHEVRGDALLAKKDTSGAAAEYRAALQLSESRGPDAALLELKISDLGVASAPVVTKAVP